VIEQKIVDERGNEIVRKIPGRLSWKDITLKRPITSEMDLWTWQKEVDEGTIDGARINGSIIMFDQTHTEVARWNFERGWLKKIGGPQMKADGNEVSMEEVIIAHERLWRVS
jgi:phage tail-like protein